MYLAVILPLLVGGGILVPWALVSAYAATRTLPVSAIADTATLPLAILGLLLWIPAGLLLANGIMFAAPPLRRVAEQYAASAAQPDFARSQRQLLKALLLSVVVCAPVIVAVFFIGH
jgi:hypothetical protein